jgi:thiol-disulfide isomerase/thioredoxin
VRVRSALLALLLCSACHQGAPASSDAAATQALAPGDPGYVAENPRLAQLIGKPGPLTTFTTIDGRTIDLGQIYGRKPVYLKLWATYCIPCRTQMPGFEKIYQSVGDRMQVVAVNAGVGDDTAKVAAFAQDAGIHMPIAIDDGSLSAWLAMRETPLHLVIGRDGRIAYAGHQDGPKLDAAIAQVLAAPAASGPVTTAALARVVALKPGDLVPTIALRDAKNTVVPLQGGATGHPRAVLFTATWCEDYLKTTQPKDAEACRRVRIEADKLAAAGPIEWRGVVSHLWTTPQDLAAYQAHVKRQIPLAVDSDGVAFRLFGIRRFPAIALIGADGRLVRVVVPDADAPVSAKPLIPPHTL